MWYIDLQEPNGNWIYFNASQIVGLEHGSLGGCIIHANGRTYEIKQSLDAVKGKLKVAGYLVP